MKSSLRFENVLKAFVSLIITLFSIESFAYQYDVACGTPSSSSRNTNRALLLVGGAEAGTSAERNATGWFLDQGDRGDYVMLRVGSTGGQASWICSNFGNDVNSAAELAVNSRSDANNSTVIDIIRDAEVIYISGGDQTEYKDFWRNTGLETALNDHMNTKPIGGTSAGMAILGQTYYAPRGTAMIGSEILNNPYHRNTDDINHGDFLRHPFMSRTVTDTHLDRRLSGETRHSRLFGLLARSVADTGSMPRYAIGLDEGTFFAVNSNWVGKVYGGSAYFLQTTGQSPERIQSGRKLKWDRNGRAVDVYKIEGSNSGRGSFDLYNWSSASGGAWSYWYTTDGFRRFNCKNGC